MGFKLTRFLRLNLSGGTVDGEQSGSTPEATPRRLSNRLVLPLFMPDLDRQFLRDTADLVKARLPDNYGFIVLAAPFNGRATGGLVYTSNIRARTQSRC